jgi:hypothetical protein
VARLGRLREAHALRCVRRVPLVRAGEPCAPLALPRLLLALARGPKGGKEATMSGDPLPELLDVKRLAAELGVTRAAAEKIMRELPLVQFPGLRKVYVRREDVRRLVDEHTTAPNVVELRRPGRRAG